MDHALGVRGDQEASGGSFLNALYKACLIRINKVLTDNGKEFTDRLFVSREREPGSN